MLPARDGSRFRGSVVRPLDDERKAVAVQRSVALAIERAGAELRDEALRLDPLRRAVTPWSLALRRGLFAVELRVLFRSLRAQPPQEPPNVELLRTKDRLQNFEFARYAGPQGPW